MVKLKTFNKRVGRLPWEDSKPSAAAKIAANIKQKVRTGRWPKDRKKEPDTTAPRRKMQLAKPKVLEDQFDIGAGPRCSKWWNLFKDGINNSGIALWLQCKHQFWLQYVCGYQIPVYNDSIEFGNIFHWLIETWHRGRLVDPHAELRTDYHRPWLEKFEGTLSTKNKQTQEGFYSLAAAMWPHYVSHYKKHWKGREVVDVEKEFRAKHTLRDKTTVRLYGTIDLVTQVGRDLHLEDHKTASFINEYEMTAALPLNFQLMFYAYVWFLITGKTVASVSHDLIRRTASKPHKNESLGNYAKRIGKEVGKSPDYYFTRITIPVDSGKLRAYQRWIIDPILEDFAAWARGSGPHYPNPHNLLGRYGPCRLFGAITTGNFSGIPRKRPHTRGVEI